MRKWFFVQVLTDMPTPEILQFIHVFVVVVRFPREDPTWLEKRALLLKIYYQNKLSLPSGQEKVSIKKFHSSK